MSGPQLDIDSIEARAETFKTLCKGRSTQWQITNEDVPVLCREVRQLRQALAAVEKVCVTVEADDEESLDTFGQHAAGSVVVVAEMVRAALGAAVTPTPQEPKCICDGGAYIDKMKPDWRPFVVNPQCVLHGIAPVTSTPEAATGPEPERECAYCGELESNCTGSRHSFLPLGPMQA